MKIDNNCKHLLSTYSVPRTVPAFTHTNSLYPELDAVITPILHVGELRHREVKLLAPGHTANEWQSGDLKPMSYTSCSDFLP